MAFIKICSLSCIKNECVSILCSWRKCTVLWNTKNRFLLVTSNKIVMAHYLEKCYWYHYHKILAVKWLSLPWELTSTFQLRELCGAQICQHNEKRRYNQRISMQGIYRNKQSKNNKIWIYESKQLLLTYLQVFHWYTVPKKKNYELISASNINDRLQIQLKTSLYPTISHIDYELLLYGNVQWFVELLLHEGSQ